MLTRKQRERWLARVENTLELGDGWNNVARLRPRSEDLAVERARQQARAWWAQMSPVIRTMAALMAED